MSLESIDDASKLRRIIEAMLLIGADLDLPAILHKLIEEARSATGARFGAIGVLNREKSGLVEFVTVGLDPETERSIGRRPKGLGVLGLVIDQAQPLRVADVTGHPGSCGFPPNHPPMTSFLGTPIKVRDEVYGNLYLTDKVGASEFTDEDLVLTEVLARSAGIAVENSWLNERAKDDAVHGDRVRLAGDLHDKVIQRIFAAGLTLQGIAGSTDVEREAERLSAVVSDLDDTIEEIRSTIFELSLLGSDISVRARFTKLVHELSDTISIPIRLTFDGPVDSAISDAVVQHLLATVRESLTNVGKHAQATEATVALSVSGDLCRVQVSDNGNGLGGSKDSGGGQGLANLRWRAERLGGHLELADHPPGGTTLDWRAMAH